MVLHSVTLRGKSCSAVSGYWHERFAAISLNGQFYFSVSCILNIICF